MIGKYLDMYIMDFVNIMLYAIMLSIEQQEAYYLTSRDLQLSNVFFNHHVREIEDTLTQNITNAMNTTKNTLNAFLLSTSVEDYDIIKSKIGDTLFLSDGEKVRGLSGKLMSILTTNYTQGRSLTIIEISNELTAHGYDVETDWLYTWESAQPRQHHVDMNGVHAHDGKFVVNGKETRGPGLFNDPSEDYNCRCQLSLKIN